MSVWRSPVFYFGVVLVLAVLAALAAPFVVPWNNYKPDLEAYGRKLTGRPVQIDGGIAVKLFPWPQLQVGGISIGNPDGMDGAPLLLAEKITTRLSLAGLANGTLDVESIDIESPQVNLVRTADGRVNWMLVPDEVVRGDGLLSRVRLDQIALHNGRLSIKDGARQFQGGMDRVEATLAAERIEGPWRMRGQGYYGDLPVELSFSSSLFEDGKPFRFGTRLTPQDKVWPSLALDGAWDGKTFKGDMRVDPQEPADGQKSSVEGQFKPLALQAAIEGNFSRFSVDKIRISPADTKDSGTLIEGYARVDLAAEPKAQLLLKSPRVNLDTLLGAGSLAQWRAGGLLALANTLLQATPETLSTDVSIDISTLTFAGDALNNVSLRGTLEKEAIRIREARADMPGRSAMLFDGIAFPGKTAAELGGSLAFESSDTRAFLAWAEPGWLDTLKDVWKGSRGRLKFQSTLNWTASQLSLDGMEYEFEGAPGKASFTAQLGTTPRLDLTVNATAIDLDNLLPQGVSLARGSTLQEVARLLAPLTDDTPGWEKNLSLSAGRLLLNGISAQGAAVDMASTARGFELKKLEVASIEGARLSGSGVMLLNDDGPSGDVKLSLAAENPGGFLQLTGLVQDPARHGWLTGLGASSAELVLRAATPAAGQADGPILQYTLAAKGGPYALDVEGAAADLVKPDTARLAFKGQLKANDGTDLLALAGLAPRMPDGKPASVSMEADGTVSAGFKTRVQFDGLSGTGTFDGVLMPKAAFAGARGNLDLTLADMTSLQRALGLPLAESRLGGRATLYGVLQPDETSIRLTQVAGEAGGTPFAGELSLDAAGAVSADVAMDRLRLQDALALALLPWEGSGVDLSSSFARSTDVPAKSSIFLRPEQLDYGYAPTATEAVIGISLEPGKRLFSLHEPGEFGQRLEISLLDREGDTLELKADGRITADLARVMRKADGTELASGLVLLDGKVSATGRSPAAVLSALAGDGRYWLSDVNLRHLSLEGFAQRILAVNSPEALTQALTGLEQGPGSPLGARTGNFSVAGGVLSLSPVGPAADGVNVAVLPRLDLTVPELNVQTTLQFTARPDLPAITLTYAGPAGALATRSGTSALAAKLGYDLLAKDMAALEALQQEQAKLAAKEEEQRKADEARFAAYQEQRAELRERARERKFFLAERQRKQAALQTALAAALKTGDALNRLDLARRARERRIWTSGTGATP